MAKILKLLLSTHNLLSIWPKRWRLQTRARARTHIRCTVCISFIAHDNTNYILLLNVYTRTQKHTISRSWPYRIFYCIAYCCCSSADVHGWNWRETMMANRKKNVFVSTNECFLFDPLYFFQSSTLICRDIGECTTSTTCTKSNWTIL